MPDTTRRNFLQRFGIGLATAGALVASPATSPDQFTYRGHVVRWIGWREPANMAMVFGLWIAARPTSKRLYAATTLGVVDEYSELECFDCTRLKDWPVISPLSSEADRSTVKERARLALLTRLDADA